MTTSDLSSQSSILGNSMHYNLSNEVVYDVNTAVLPSNVGFGWNSKHEAETKMANRKEVSYDYDWTVSLTSSSYVFDSAFLYDFLCIDSQKTAFQFVVKYGTSFPGFCEISSNQETNDSIVNITGRNFQLSVDKSDVKLQKTTNSSCNQATDAVARYRNGYLFSSAQERFAHVLEYPEQNHVVESLIIFS